jgi:hypothetical protein
LQIGNSPSPLFFVSDQNKGLEARVFSITFEVVETQGLAEEGFRPKRGGLCRETNPRALMDHHPT